MKNSIKNQISKLKARISVLAFAIISMFTISCGVNGGGCDATNTLFNQIYTNAANAAGNTDRNYMDSYMHQYDFTVSTNKVICSVGYKGFVAQPYKIEIIDNTASSTLYTNTNTFNTAVPSYVSVPNITVVPGHSYAIRRTFAGVLSPNPINIYNDL